MVLTPGTTVGVYEIAGLIGIGGMGEVYRATDTNLKRQVALKVLPAAVAADPERLGRFQREAEVLAALNHPRIAAIHGLERSGGVTALVMEFVDGEDLSQRLGRGPIPADEALPIAGQIVEALAAAHEQGIVHRDLKPANIKVRSDGTVKVLDFGLAKATDPTLRAATWAGGPPVDSPTITTPAMTRAGIIMGTAAYMSPEQARGKPVDKRTDIWAFGCVLYEMLTGRHAFDGETVTDVLSAIVKTEPDWQALPVTTPRPVHRLLRRSLEKDARRRLADIADARFELDEAADGERILPADNARAGWRTRSVPAAWLAAAVLAVAALAAVVSWGNAGRAVPVRASASWVATTLALDVPNLTALIDRFAVAPDGSAVVVVGSRGGLSVRRPSALDAAPIPGVPPDAFSPVFSPDSRWIAFSSQGALMKIPTEGGTPAIITRGAEDFTNLTWGPDNRLRYPTSDWNAIQSVPAAGGPVERLALGPGTRISRAEWLPGGHLLVSTTTEKGMQIAVREVDGTLRIVAEGWDGRLSPSGHLLYSRAEGQAWALVAAPFDTSRGMISGAAVVVAPNVAAYYSTPAMATRDGDLFYMGGTPRSDRRVVILDRTAGEREIVLPQAAWVALAASPDGQSLALSRWEGARRTLWTVTLATGALSQATYAYDTFKPVWSADGRHLLFTHFPVAPGAPRTSIWSVVPDGRGQIEPVPAELDAYPEGVSADGKTLFYERYRVGQDQSDIFALNLKVPGQAPVALLSTPASEESPRPSPDGRWLAYSTNASGTRQTRIASLVDTKAVVQVTEASGDPIGWSSTGARLFYRDAAAIWSVGVSDSGPLLATRRVAFRLPRDLVGTPAVVGGGQQAILIRGGAIYSDLIVRQGVLTRR